LASVVFASHCDYALLLMDCKRHFNTRHPPKTDFALKRPRTRRTRLPHQCAFGESKRQQGVKAAQIQGQKNKTGPRAFRICWTAAKGRCATICATLP
jgi:hypothetical protein